jgi:hypothetical protein
MSAHADHAKPSPPPLPEAIAQLALSITMTPGVTRGEQAWLNNLIERLGELADQATTEYERVRPVEGDSPTAAQGVALATFLRSRLQHPDEYATVSLGSPAGMLPNYVLVRFSDGYEGGIDREGRVST